MINLLLKYQSLNVNVSACCRFHVRVFRGVRKEEREVTPRVLIYLFFFIEGDVTKVLVPEELLK